jgi:hypothetical protein
MLDIFAIRKDPDFRNYRALDYVCSEFNDLIRAEGGRNAQIERSVLVERALAAKIPRLEVEAAITIFTLAKHISSKKMVFCILRPASFMSHFPASSDWQRRLDAMKRASAYMKSSGTLSRDAPMAVRSMPNRWTRSQSRWSG